MTQDRSGTQIRLLRPHEHDELRQVRLSALAYSPHLADHLAEETAAGPDFWRQRAELAASAVTVATFVAVEGSAFVGVVDGYLAEDRGTVEIGGMWVIPQRRRAGVGRELLGAICDWARSRGAVRVGLWVRGTNRPARHLYESHGFDLVEGSGGGVGVRLEKTL